MKHTIQIVSIIIFIFENVVYFSNNISYAQEQQETSKSQEFLESSQLQEDTDNKVDSKSTKLEPKKRVVTEKTTFDFEETLLEGKVKAPNVLILRGRSKQPKTQMIYLKSNFRQEIERTRPAMRGIK